jgi:hypothetical protein
MTKLNVAALAAIASAPPPPVGVKVEGAVSTDTKISWIPSLSTYGYRIWRRRTDASQWEIGGDVTPGFLMKPSGILLSAETATILPHIRVDDWVFGVSSVSKDGFESPVASAVPGGAFKPFVAPAKK